MHRARADKRPHSFRPRRAAVSLRSVGLTLLAFACGVGLLNVAQYFWLRAMRDAVEQSRHEMPEFNRPLEIQTFDADSLIYKPPPIALSR
jgi:hypothetical protein